MSRSRRLLGLVLVAAGAALNARELVSWVRYTSS
jgi:hypothetical protein